MNGFWCHFFPPLDLYKDRWKERKDTVKGRFALDRSHAEKQNGARLVFKHVRRKQQLKGEAAM